MQRASNWIPKQHGAWAMLIVPVLVGIVLRSRVTTLEVWLICYCIAVLSGYLGFNAVSIWAKAPAARRSGFIPAAATYTVIAFVSGLVTIVTAGWRILGWAPPAIVLLAVALVLVSRREDRAVLSGVVTTAAAAGLGFVARFKTVGTLLTSWPGSAPDSAVLFGIFCYFFGTVLHVKALLRERGQPASRARTVAYHAALILLSVAGWFAGLLHVAWIGFAIVLLVRTAVMTRPNNVGRFSALRIGMLEVLGSVLVVVVSLL